MKNIDHKGGAEHIYIYIYILEFRARFARAQFSQIPILRPACLGNRVSTLRARAPVLAMAAGNRVSTLRARKPVVATAARLDLEPAPHLYIYIYIYIYIYMEILDIDTDIWLERYMGG